MRAPRPTTRNFFALSGACPSYDAVTTITGVPAGSAPACSSSGADGRCDSPAAARRPRCAARTSRTRRCCCRTAPVAASRRRPAACRRPRRCTSGRNGARGDRGPQAEVAAAARLRTDAKAVRLDRQRLRDLELVRGIVEHDVEALQQHRDHELRLLHRERPADAGPRAVAERLPRVRRQLLGVLRREAVGIERLRRRRPTRPDRDAASAAAPAACRPASAGSGRPSIVSSTGLTANAGAVGHSRSDSISTCSR